DAARPRIALRLARRRQRVQAEPRASSTKWLEDEPPRSQIAILLLSVCRPAFGGKFGTSGCPILPPPRPVFPLRWIPLPDRHGNRRNFRDARGETALLWHPMRSALATRYLSGSLNMAS